MTVSEKCTRGHLAITHARVEERVGQIHEQRCRGDADDGEQGDAHDHVVVRRNNGVVERAAQARIAEDDFGDQRALKIVPSERPRSVTWGSMVLRIR